MALQTKLSPKHRYTAYLTKHLRVDLQDEMRVIAALRQCTMEDVINLALEVALPILHEQTMDDRKAQRAAQRGTIAI